MLKLQHSRGLLGGLTVATNRASGANVPRCQGEVDSPVARPSPLAPLAYPPGGRGNNCCEAQTPGQGIAVHDVQHQESFNRQPQAYARLRSRLSRDEDEEEWGRSSGRIFALTVPKKIQTTHQRRPVSAEGGQVTEKCFRRHHSVAVQHLHVR